MNENNDSNVTQTEKIIETLDLELEDSTQEFLAQLYSSEYGSYLAQTYFGIPLANLITAFLALFFL